jgi:hypothetical protein
MAGDIELRDGVAESYKRDMLDMFSIRSRGILISPDEMEQIKEAISKFAIGLSFYNKKVLPVIGSNDIRTFFDRWACYYVAQKRFGSDSVLCMGSVIGLQQWIYGVDIFGSHINFRSASPFLQKHELKSQSIIRILLDACCILSFETYFDLRYLEHYRTGLTSLEDVGIESVDQKSVVTSYLGFDMNRIRRDPCRLLYILLLRNFHLMQQHDTFIPHAMPIGSVVGISGGHLRMTIFGSDSWFSYYESILNGFRGVGLLEHYCRELVQYVHGLIHSIGTLPVECVCNKSKTMNTLDAIRNITEIVGYFFFVMRFGLDTAKEFCKKFTYFFVFHITKQLWTCMGPRLLYGRLGYSRMTSLDSFYRSVLNLLEIVGLENYTMYPTTDESEAIESNEDYRLYRILCLFNLYFVNDNRINKGSNFVTFIEGDDMLIDVDDEFFKPDVISMKYLLNSVCRLY